MTISTSWLEEGETEVQLRSTNRSDDPFHVMVPEHLVKVVEDFNGKKLGWVRKGAVRQYPITPERKINAVEAEQLSGFCCVDFDVGWVEMVGEGIEGWKHVDGCSWGMLEGITELLERRCGEVGCFAGNSSQGASFRRIGDVCSEWCEAVTNVASVVSHPGSITCSGLQREGDKVQACVNEAVFQEIVEFLLHTEKLGDRDQREEFEGM